jgi:RNA polymerase sigma-70 factor (ECF subfamily)
MMAKMSTQQFEQIYEKYKTTLFRVSFTYLKNNHDVQDVLQEVFLKRYYCKTEFTDEEHEKNWMIRVTINLSKDLLKSFWKRNIGSIEDDSFTEAINQFGFMENEKELFRQVMSLPEKNKIAIYLHYYEGYSCKEIATMIRCSESAVKMRLKNGRNLLKVKLKEGWT